MNPVVPLPNPCHTLLMTKRTTMQNIHHRDCIIMSTPQKSHRTQSKQKYIKESKETRTRSRSQKARSKSHSRRRAVAPVTPITGVDWPTNTTQVWNEHHVYRARSKSKSKYSSRQRSWSQTRSSGSISIGTFDLEPNVHHNAIMTTEIQCPVVAEMKQNELFARKAGINLKVSQLWFYLPSNINTTRFTFASFHTAQKREVMHYQLLVVQEPHMITFFGVFLNIPNLNNNP